MIRPLFRQSRPLIDRIGSGLVVVSLISLMMTENSPGQPIVNRVLNETAVVHPSPLYTGACGNPGSCFEIHFNPGCADVECCEAVCAQDSYCCTNQWDETCTIIAGLTCEVPDGCPGVEPCFIAHDTPGCASDACCQLVCADESACCDSTWSDECASTALQLCELPSGCPSPGTCGGAHGTPGCDDETCCAVVCSHNPGCCATSWTFECAVRAWSECGGTCGSGGDCFALHGPGCQDVGCCSTICAADTFCCETQWDQSCIDAALVSCAGIGACGGDESCVTPHGTAGCGDEVCCQSVCMLNPACCFEEWSTDCAQMAIDHCESVNGCPGDGDCLEIHETPGCADASCCESVCEQDSFCCHHEWDEFCVANALVLCGALKACPGEGSCDEPHDNPGCDNEGCCQYVCVQRPSCCTEVWDASCTTIAQACHGPTCPPATILSAQPVHGTIDARMPHPLDALVPRYGIGGETEGIGLVMSVPVPPECFELCESAVDSLLGPNSIALVDGAGDPGSYRIVLHHPITPGAVTRIRYTGSGDYVDYISHPGNANGDTVANPVDILSMINALNGVEQLPFGWYSADLDHSLLVGPPDILRVIDLLNGAGALEVWNGTALPTMGDSCP